MSHTHRSARLLTRSAQRTRTVAPSRPLPSVQHERRQSSSYIHHQLDQRRFRGVVVATLVAGLLTEWFTGIPSRVPAQLAALAGWRAGDRAAEIAAAVEDDQPREPMSRAVQVEQVVERLLTSYYGNDVPSAEQRRWRDVAGQGPIDLTVIEFMGSTDTIKDHYASGSPDWFVKEAYDVMLGRQPDYYAHGSVSLAKTWEGRLGVISAIASSPEFLERRGG